MVIGGKSLPTSKLQTRESNHCNLDATGRLKISLLQLYSRQEKLLMFFQTCFRGEAEDFMEEWVQGRYSEKDLDARTRVFAAKSFIDIY